MLILYSHNVALSVAFLVLFAYSMVVQRRYLRRAWDMAGSLSPSAKFTEFYVARWTQVASFLLEASLAPFIALSLIRRSSEWGGINYHIRCGKVVHVEHSAPTPPMAAPAAT